MVHRDLRAMTRYAAERGIHPMICTNGGLWNDENMRGLASDGLTSVIMSIDAHDINAHEKNRGLPDVCKKIKKANEFFHSVGIQTTASITASRLIEDYEKLPAFLETLGYSVLREGNILELPGVKLSVEEACSGIRSLTAILFMCVIYNYFFVQGRGTRWLILAAAVPIAIFGNALRILATGIASQYDPALVTGAAHEAFGYVAIAAAAAGCLAVHILLVSIQKTWKARHG